MRNPENKEESVTPISAPIIDELRTPECMSTITDGIVLLAIQTIIKVENEKAVGSVVAKIVIDDLEFMADYRQHLQDIETLGDIPPVIRLSFEETEPV